MFNRRITERMARWFDYVDFRLKSMDERINEIEKRVAEASLKENAKNADKK